MVIRAPRARWCPKGAEGGATSSGYGATMLVLGIEPVTSARAVRFLITETSLEPY